ncbi:MAG: 30S ribosomal protein S13 [Dehalococcoidales bacterium]|jgi:small subunit ribosomal protein S13|nr:30S ribosomal protein S13 [Dehalococcoidales bacterium]MDD4229974.1 30S ribosomal protein S13 [Dehalococcoidales bacterium]MDD4466008.1 30S ribosomal protein S13 [Dehalococcoidales bacterium]MDD5402568.1 30S ribosomal protein S13 [Dehalococcoidales bacterium]
MARIAGVDIPKTKQVWVALQYIYGIGRTTSLKILDEVGIERTKEVSSLTEDEINRLREVIAKGMKVEGDLRKENTLNIKRLMDIGCYRGIRHRRNLPARGQRTRTNARTRRGERKTVAGRGQRRGMAKK